MSGPVAFLLSDSFFPHKGGRPYCQTGSYWLQGQVTVPSKPLKSAQLCKFPTGTSLSFWSFRLCLSWTSGTQDQTRYWNQNPAVEAKGTNARRHKNATQFLKTKISISVLWAVWWLLKTLLSILGTHWNLLKRFKNILMHRTSHILTKLESLEGIPKAAVLLKWSQKF